jgi:NAD(P)-dependent dehydrogenase (short-subunit alcohol dehydrogenase family)
MAMSDDRGRRVALITGASRGIGAAIAVRLAGDGLDIVLTYQRSAEAAEAVAARVGELGVEALALRIDAADPKEPATAVDRAVERFGRLDVVVNNAGVYEMASLTDATDEQFERAFATNVRSAFLTARAAARVLPSGGRIINIGSILGERVALPNVGIYSATKFAIQGFTRAWARDLGPRGITVNAVQPGPIDTDMNPAAGRFAEHQRAMTALRRFGRPEEVAAAVAFLASPAAGYITGEILNVDGGSVA